MGSRLPQQSHSTPTGTPRTVVTPVKQQQVGGDQFTGCPYGSPVSGLCTAPPAAPAAAASAAKTRLRLDTTGGHSARPRSVQQQDNGLKSSPAYYATQQQHIDAQACRTSSMPELWQAASWSGRNSPRPGLGADQLQHQGQQQLRLSADNRPRRDQDLSQSSPQPSPRSSLNSSSGHRRSLQESPSAEMQQMQLQQQALLPIDVLLSPLLPSADEAKLVDRLSQLRHALDEHVRLAGGWEQQAVTLQGALSEVQEESLVLRGQVASQQHHISLLGGNLQGRLAMVQGSVLAQMQEQANHKDAAVAASTQQVLAIQAELERLSCSYAAKLAAEQAERQRLSAEAAQARLLCTARGRQVSSLQQELQQLRDAAAQQQQTAAASTSVQQQQLESLRERLQDSQRQLAAAQQGAVEAQAAAAAAEGGKAGLREQVEELQALLSERQLQVEWLEAKVADVEGSDISQQLRRHQAEVTRLQEAATADRRALEQQLAGAQRQLSQLQQQDAARQQQVEQLEQQAQYLQQQLAQQQAVSQELEQQQVHSSGSEAELAQQLSMADAELQQLREQLAEAEDEIAALSQRLQQQELEQHHHQAQQDFMQSAELGTAADNDGGGDGDDGSPRVAAAVVHALRAELGIANAEVARLRHQLDVSQTSQQQERELTGHEILRLQQELSEAAASGSGAAAGGDAADEVTSRMGLVNRVGSSSTSSWHSVHDNPAFEQAQQQQQSPSELQALLTADGEEECDECEGEEGQEYGSQELVMQAGADVAAGDGEQLLRYEAKLQDQADTISSLQRQLKQQEQLLAALQKRERRVFDSAASKGSWAEALGLDQDAPLQPRLPAHLTASVPHAAAAAAGSVVEPATPQADAAVQTDLSGPAESAGSTAAAPAATASEGRAGLQQQREQAEQQACSRQQQSAVAEAGAELGASSALLAAARHEILRLQELNRQLMQAHAEELKASVSFDDARRAVSEAKQHAKAKAAAMLQSSNKTWSEKLSAARAEAVLLQEQLQDLQLQRDQLAQQLSSVSQSHTEAVQQLQQELVAAQQHSQALTRQLQDMADSHMQELEQVRMEMEADAAAAMLDAAAASNKLEQQQQEQQQRASCSIAVQTAAAAAVEARDAVVQTEGHIELPVQHPQQQQQRQLPPAVDSSSSSNGDTRQVHQQQATATVQQQQQQHEDLRHAEQQHHPLQQHRVDGPDSTRPCTPQPAAAAPAAAASVAGASAAGQADAAAEPALEQVGTPQQQRLVSSWRTAAAAAAADAGDDDICRFSSASDTPASASSRGPVSRFRGSLAAATAGLDGSSMQRPGSGGQGPEAGGVQRQGSSGVGAADGWRPGSAGTVILPECMPTSSPIAPSTATGKSALLAQQQAAAHAAAAHGQHWQQQQQAAADGHQWQQQQQPKPQQQQAAADGHHWQPQQQQLPVTQGQHWQPQQPQVSQQQADSGPGQMSSWHAELLQQQVELEALRARLSQQRQPPPWKQQQGGPVSSSRGSSAVAHSRALLLAPFGPSISRSAEGGGADGSVAGGVFARGAVGSPAGPVASSSSPLSFQQRRAAAQQVAAAAAGVAAAVPRSGGGLSTEVSAGLLQQGRPFSLQQPGEAAAEPRQQQQQQQAAAAGLGGAAGYSRWRSSSSPDGLYNNDDSLLFGSPQPYSAAAGGAAGGVRSAGVSGTPGSMHSAGVGSWGMSLTAAAAAAPAGLGAITGGSSAGTTGTQQQLGSSSRLGSSSFNQSVGTAAAGAAGLSQLGSDVLGALSLSRYHRERSKLQEARAKQHALMASHHEDQAAALRNSRLGAPANSTAAGGAVVGSAGAAYGATGVSPSGEPGSAWGGAGGTTADRLL